MFRSFAEYKYFLSTILSSLTWRFATAGEELSPSKTVSSPIAEPSESFATLTKENPSCRASCFRALHRRRSSRFPKTMAPTEKNTTPMIGRKTSSKIGLPDIEHQSRSRRNHALRGNARDRYYSQEPAIFCKLLCFAIAWQSSRSCKASLAKLSLGMKGMKTYELSGGDDGRRCVARSLRDGMVRPT